MELRVLAVAIAILFGGCESSGGILLDAKHLLEVSETTFLEHLSDKFIVHRYHHGAPAIFQVVGPRLKLPGQHIWITYDTSETVELPSDLGKAARLAQKYRNEEENYPKKEVVSIIEIILPYRVSRLQAIRMLGYRAKFFGQSAEDGLWQDEASGHTITVVHLDGIYKTRIIVSVASRSYVSAEDKKKTDAFWDSLDFGDSQEEP